MADTTDDGNQREIPPARRKRLQRCFEHGSKMAAQDNFDYATVLFTQCVAGDPNNFMYLQSFLGNLKKKYNNNKKGSNLAFIKSAGARAMVRKAVAQKDWAGVIKAGLEVLKLNPWDVSTLTAMADACEKGGFEETELLYLKTALETDSKDPNVCRLCAMALGKRGQYDQAIAMWHRVEQARPGDEEAARHIASLAVEKTITQGGYEESDPSKKKRMPGGAAGQGAAVEMLSEEDRLERDIARRPKDIPPYLELADLFIREDRFDKAEDALARALEASDGDVTVRERWEDVQIRRLRHELLMLEKQVKETGSEELKTRHGQLRKDLFAKELDVYKARAERYPNNLAFKYDLGVRYQLNGRYNEAIAEYQLARNDPRRKGLCMLNLGQCFQHIKQDGLAMSHYEEAIKEIPDRDADNKKKALYLAAKLAFKLGDLDTAERHATTLAAMDFSYRDVAQLLDAIAQRRKGPDEQPKAEQAE